MYLPFRGLLLSLWLGGWVAGQAPLLPPPMPMSFPGTRPAATTGPLAAAEDAMPLGVMRELYRRELGARYEAGLDERLYRAHVLIEKYFATTSAEDRRALVKMLQGTDLDPNVLGRITRLRLGWPALDGGGIFYVNERIGPHHVHYFLGVPRTYDRRVAWPVVIKLPTAHAFITQPPPGPDEVARIYAQWISQELQDHPDALVLMPLLNLAELWGPSYPGMNSVIQPMHHAAGRVNIDPARVYLIGHSMSGHATWNLALHYPTYLAAINPMAGGAPGDWQRVRLWNLRNVLPVVWHDAEDPAVKVEHSRAIVRVMRMHKLDVDYEETKGMGRAPTAEMAEKLYRKTRARVRELYPAHVILQSSRPDTLFNRNDWIQVYQPLRPGKEQRMFMRRGSGPFVVYEHPFKLEAKLAGRNKVEAFTENVESMRFYFNEQMVDMSKPVTVNVNRKTRFEGMLRPSVEEMLKDQVFLGRGWRYYTAVVDVDFGEIRPATTRAGTRPATTRRGVIEVFPPEGSEEPPRRIEK